jgi:AAA domain/UvrD-like helicase C-terminal domain
MSDDTAARALRSDARLVVIEAPAGCGKTFQGAEYVSETAAHQPKSRILVLTHTHAACDVFAKRTQRARNIEIRTIDSLISQIAGVYHTGLGLPADPSAWARKTGSDGYDTLAAKSAELLRRTPMIAHALAQRYPVMVCDEHQDCTADQHDIAMALHKAGARLRIFADPMQSIYTDNAGTAAHQARWKELQASAHFHERLDTPHRWCRAGAPALGKWILEARETLRSGGRIDLRGSLPAGLTIASADNQARRCGQYQLGPEERKPLDALVRSSRPLLLLTAQNPTARGLRAFFNRRIPLWEGHTREALATLVASIGEAGGNTDLLAQAIVVFLEEVAVGLSPSAFGDAFKGEVSSGCTARRRDKPAKVQQLARLLLDKPSHVGVAAVLRQLDTLIASDQAFSDVKIDSRRKLNEAMRLHEFEDCEEGFSEISRRRTFARPSPPDQAISTIHKAKGLETDHVAVIPCDARHFDDGFKARCLLYVAISRPKKSLTLVIPTVAPSPLFIL